MVKEQRLDIHDHAKQLQSVLRRIENHHRITAPNKKILLKFHRKLSSDNLSLPRVLYYLNRLSVIGGWFKKDFDAWDRADVEKALRKINEMDYTEWTKKDYRVSLKKFFQWIRDLEGTGTYPPEVAWIKTHITMDKQELPGNLPTEEDMKKMVELAEHPRDKALIACLYESGCRVGELASLTLGDLHYDEYGAVIVVKGKTGGRRIRLIFSAPILANWLNIHPEKDNPHAPLWIVIGTTKNFSKANTAPTREYTYRWSYALKYPGIAKLLKKAAQKAGVKKKVNPHAWRHARATFLANKLTEQQLKHLFGWAPSSDMASTYVHLSGRDVDDALLAVYGRKKVAENTTTSLDPLECPRCRETNEYSNLYCKKCGWILDRQAAVRWEEKRKQADTLLNSLLKDPDSLKQIAAALAKLGLVDELMKL